MDRRPLTAGLTAIPNADPEAVREFVTQNRRPKTELTEKTSISDRPLVSQVGTAPASWHKSKMGGVTPVGLIPVTVRLRPDIAGALKRASLERQLAGEDLFTQQDLVEHVLEPWLRAEGHLI